MAYTIPVSFDKFLENISISGSQETISKSRRDRIVKLLGNDFTILEAFATGSIPKYTAVKGSDLDIIVALHYGKHVKGKLPSVVLASVQKSLSGYVTNVRRNGQAVTLSYQTWPSVDIVPVSRTDNEDGSVNHYNVPNMNTEAWIDSTPKRHAMAIANQVKSFGPEFRRIIRMIKWWNRQHSRYLQSYHIEVLALKILNGKFDEYSWELFQFFKQAHELVKTALWHELGFVDNYLSYSDRQEALKRLATARDRARDAWYKTHGKNNDVAGAVNIWRQMFGDKFPSYG